MSQYPIIKTTLSSNKEFKTIASIGEHQLILDEPFESGGNNEGPTPTQTAIAALGACVAMTIKIYLDHKDWKFDSIDCELDFKIEKVEDPSVLTEEEQKYVIRGQLRRIKNIITMKADFDENQVNRVKIIAGKCPVHKLMEGSVLIEDELKLI